MAFRIDWIKNRIWFHQMFLYRNIRISLRFRPGIKLLQALDKVVGYAYKLKFSFEYDWDQKKWIKHFFTTKKIK